MRRALVLALAALPASLLLASSAHADTFGGFSGVDRPYLVNSDRVCAPLAVTSGTATGMPACDKAPADVVAKLSMKAPIPQSGAKATFAATVSGRTLTVTRKIGGTPVVTWTAPDAIGKVVDVYASQYEDRIAVTYTTRRLGKEVTDVVAFDLGQGAATTPTQPPVTNPTNPTTTPTPPTATPVEDPKLTKAIVAARKAPKGAKAIAAWKAVLAVDPAHAEATYRLAAAQALAKQPPDALATLATLATSTRPDAIEWRIEARFDPAFASVRADPKFRAAAGLDKKGTSAYERLMGFGGQWEQTGTSCDKPEIRFTTLRDRTFKLRVKTVCQGSVFDTPFKGTWRIEGTRIVLTLPTRGKQVSAADEAGCELVAQGDEDALHCVIGRDIDFTVLPTRR
ncbi:MAG: hypothetical protein H0T89_31795 [Deltaproteobacteria bacterium]|nr:hypothetical protein [Deltaproteobacteria bacterium]MDQ3298156.1 hypothetical protein [Myxococcota bacterium]